MSDLDGTPEDRFPLDTTHHSVSLEGSKVNVFVAFQVQDPSVF